MFDHTAEYISVFLDINKVYFPERLLTPYDFTCPLNLKS